MSLLKKLVAPWKRKGYQQIGTYDSSKPHAGDLAVLAQIEAHGSDLTRERHIVHYLYFSTADGRDHASAALEIEGYTARPGVVASEYEHPYLLTAERTGLVNEAEITRERELFTSIAEANAGSYDGWEAALD